MRRLTTLALGAFLLLGTWAPPTEAGPPGHALRFDATAEHVAIRSSALAAALEGGHVTIEAWIRPEKEDPIFNYKSIVVLDDMWDFYFGHPGRLGALVRLDGGIPFGATTPPGALPRGDWTHVAMTYDGYDIRVYRDAVLVAQGYHPGLPATANPAKFLAKIGYFAGVNADVTSIDEVRIWNTARTGTQIGQAMNVILPGGSPGLVAYYRFEEGEGQRAEDISGQGNHGILGTSESPDVADPKWIKGGAPVS